MIESWDPRLDALDATHDISSRREVFERLFREHFDTILAFATRRSDPATAHDVASEVFLIAWRRLEEVPDGLAARSWLYGCAHRVLSNKRRGVARERALIEKIRASSPTISVGFDEASIDSDRLRAAIQTLSDSDREVLALVTADGLSHREAAQVLGVRENTFTVRYQRARRRLRAALEHCDSIDQSSLRLVGGA